MSSSSSDAQPFVTYQVPKPFGRDSYPCRVHMELPRPKDRGFWLPQINKKYKWAKKMGIPDNPKYCALSL